MESSSSAPSASPLQFVMAALVGASVMAISAFYLHKRSVDQVLDQLIELRKLPSNARPQPFETEEDESQDEQEDEDVASDIDIDRRFWRQGISSSYNDHATYAYRVSSSMPNVLVANDWMNEGTNFTQATSFDKLNLIPSGLPALQTAPRDGIVLFVFHFVNQPTDSFSPSIAHCGVLLKILIVVLLPQNQ